MISFLCSKFYYGPNHCSRKFVFIVPRFCAHIRLDFFVTVVCTRYCSTLPRLTSHFSRQSRDLIISVISAAPCRDKGSCLQPVWFSVYHSREMAVYTPFAVKLEIYLHNFCPRDHIIMSRFLCDRRRGIGLSTGFITSYNQLQHD
jgi:hypothetical protein